MAYLEFPPGGYRIKSGSKTAEFLVVNERREQLNIRDRVGPSIICEGGGKEHTTVERRVHLGR